MCNLLREVDGSKLLLELGGRVALLLSVEVEVENLTRILATFDHQIDSVAFKQFPSKGPKLRPINLDDCA